MSMTGEGVPGADDGAIDAYVEAALNAKTHAQKAKAEAMRRALDPMDAAAANINLERRRARLAAEATYADLDHPANVGKKAEALVKADESTRKMDARHGFKRPNTQFQGKGHRK
jgi:hypothetical protein